jgi:hypothetical protein
MTGSTLRQTLGVALVALLIGHGAIAHAQNAETRSSSGSLISSGLLTFGLGYGAAVAVAATSSHQGDNRLYVPLLGPWLDIGDRGSCGVENPSCDHETTNKLLLVGDGIVQGVGALTILAGILTPPRPVYAAKNAPRYQLAPASLGRGKPGLIAFGTF